MQSQDLQLELGWPVHQADNLFQFLDQDRDGHVTMAELKAFMRVQLIFNKIDKNRTGFIGPFEFGESLGNPSISGELGVPQHQAQNVFRDIDRDRSGTVTFAEFFRFFVNRLGPQNQQQSNHQAKALVGGDKYIQVKKLGEGTFGVVFLIKRKVDGLELIMKKPKIVPGSTMEDVKAEAAMLSRVKHPHIVRYTESYWDKGALIIITEFAGGGDLRSKLVPNRGCGNEKTMLWFLQACDAVAYLHERFILHRDLKPDNIFLTAGGSVKVGDLGLATQLRDEQDVAMTQCGTQIYMAPELLHSRPEYDEKVDVWAMGCILYEMSTGKFAFDSVTAIVRGSVPRDCPHYCADIVRAMLDVDPQNRVTMHEVLDMMDYAPVTGMASYMSDRYLNKNRQGGAVISPNDVYYHDQQHGNNGYGMDGKTR